MDAITCKTIKDSYLCSSRYKTFAAGGKSKNQFSINTQTLSNQMNAREQISVLACPTIQNGPT